MPNTKVIYTALTKGYDRLLQPEVLRPDYDYICFSNDLGEADIGVWKIRKIPYANPSGTRLTRYPKLNPHRVLPEYAYSIWVDANVRITESLLARADELIGANAVCAMIRHPKRHCVYQEARYLIAYSIGESDQIYAQARYLQDHHFPPNAGLYTCSIILRKHHEDPVVKFSEAWWDQYVNFSSRDQMGVSYALSCAKLTPSEFMPSDFLSEVIVKHNPASPAKLAKRIVRYSRGRIYLLRLRLLSCSCISPSRSFKQLCQILHAWVARCLPDEWYLRLVYKRITGKVLHLNPPRTFNEKIQWMKLYDRRPIYTTLADKFTVREHIKTVLGEQYLIPLLGVWDRAEDIDFGTLPDQFVLKATHDSGSVVICRDKAGFDVQNAKSRLNQSLRRNFYWVGGEWAYKHVKPRIIAEAFLSDAGRIVPEDYKLYCFNGEPKLVVVFHNRFNASEPLSESVYDLEWNLLPCSLDNHFQIETRPQPKPACLDELVHLARTLCRGTPQMRTDFYVVSGRIYFGEITLYTASGFQPMIPPEYDKILGEWIDLPNKRGK